MPTPDEITQTLLQRAESLRSHGKTRQAERLYRQALNLPNNRCPKDASYARTLNGLANLLFEQKLYPEAERLYLRSLSLRKKLFGNTHRDVASSLSNLANLLQSTGKHAKAERLYLESLKIRKKVYGARHENVAMCLSNLAVLKQAQGKLPQAKRLLKQALWILGKTVGSTHELTAFTKANLADLLLQTPGENKAASSLAQKALSDLQRNLPAAHRYVKWARDVSKRAKSATPFGK